MVKKAKTAGTGKVGSRQRHFMGKIVSPSMYIKNGRKQIVAMTDEGDMIYADGEVVLYVACPYVV